MNIRREQLEGRPHYVVPAVLIREGVLSGSQGPLYYPLNEIKSTAGSWNGVAVVVRHPSSGTANDPQVFDTSRVGTVFNVTTRERRLTGEVWIDIAQANRVDTRIVNAVENRKTLEVSTGLMVASDNVAGVHNGTKFVGTARGPYLPDHLAILPDEVGACSVLEGCGLLRNELSHVEEPLAIPTVV